MEKENSFVNENFDKGFKVEKDNALVNHNSVSHIRENFILLSFHCHRKFMKR